MNFKYYYLRFRSATYARHASKILNGQNISSYVIRLPQNLAETGCGYAVKIKTENLEPALRALQSGQIEVLKIYEKYGENYQEVRF